MPEESVAARRDQLFQMLYSDLHHRAAMLLRRERKNHSFGPTDLVHAAYLRLLRSSGKGLSDRAYLFAAASRAMAQALVDHARERNAKKRGGDQQRVPLLEDQWLEAAEVQKVDVIALNEALDELAKTNLRQTLVVTFRCFLGLSVPEVAELLDVSISTVESDWRSARAWLANKLADDSSEGSSH